ncbi:hypothetical protein GLOIN_2v744607 [Rhizophagus irregularis DAOM 181602=DAOM 197198]|nr:hypothetical protein GLOIN_2v744607 [Rhizophagus irregularis DAOM 181602=DAOM 197198]
MSSELKLLRQRISELETKNAKLETEKAEIEAKNAELLKLVMEKDAKHDAEITELKLRVDNPLSAVEVSGSIVDQQNNANQGCQVYKQH